MFKKCHSSVMLILTLMLIVIVLPSCAKSNSNLLDNVDPYIGTGGHGHTFLGPSVPFGAIQPGPQNINKGWDWCSGYHYSDTVLIGFSHLHLSGTGIGDLGDILVMPTTGAIKTNKGSQDNPDSGYASRYTHDTEIAKPYYYALTLDDYDIRAELTATERVALHQYTFPAGKTANLIIDLQEGNNDRATETFIKKIDDKTIGGYRYSSGWAREQKVFFAMTLDTDPTDFVVFDGDKRLPETAGKSDKIKAAFTFLKLDKPVKVKVAISPVSVENALLNIEKELPGWDFAPVIAASKAKWNAELAKIDFESDNDTTKRIFYTALYHTMISPVLFNDVNNDYRGVDEKIYKNASYDNYSIFSLWDTYRAQHPLMTIIQTKRVPDMVDTMLGIYDQQGFLPIWHLMGYETFTMVGYHGVPVVIDAYFKGLTKADPERIFEAVKASAMTDRAGMKYIKELGYLPSDKERESVAKALEYCIDDACIARMAKKLGKQKDYDYFLKRSQSYKTYFDKETEFMRGVMSDKSWHTPFDPVASKHRDDDYCEGNAWQYTWLVPHDPEGLIGLFGSDEAFIKKLDALFNASSELGEGASADITGLIGQYAHGNEPGHHITYMYAFAGQQWKTAERVRQVLREMYTDKIDGLSGNEDCGQMSAWYVLSAMGFYPVNPANGVYVLGSPAMDKATINLENGQTFTITAKGNSDENIYIQSVTYNGKPYSKSYITHDMIMGGGNLTLVMGAEPNESFGKAKADRPNSAM